MKGCSTKGKMGWMSGGAVRNLGGGIKAPRYGTDKAVMDEAKKTKSEGIVKMDVEGERAKPRMDRPGRKFGGRMMEHKKTKDEREADDADRDDKAEYARGGKVFDHPLKKNALRKELHIKDGEKIPEKKLEKAEHSDNPKERRRAELAETMRHWKKG